MLLELSRSSDFSNTQEIGTLHVSFDISIPPVPWQGIQPEDGENRNYW